MTADEYIENWVEEFDKPYNIRHRCYFFSKAIIQFVLKCNYEKVFVSLFDQLVRSASSIGANVVEGRAGSSKKDWINFFSIALKSANETKYWLYLIKDTILNMDKNKIEELIKECDEISKIIASIIITSKKL